MFHCNYFDKIFSGWQRRRVVELWVNWRIENRRRRRGTADEGRDGPRYVSLLTAELCDAAANPRTFYQKIETDFIATAHIRARLGHLTFCVGRSDTGSRFFSGFLGSVTSRQYDSTNATCRLHFKVTVDLRKVKCVLGFSNKSYPLSDPEATRHILFHA